MRRALPLLLAALAPLARADDIPVCGPTAVAAHREAAPSDRLGLENRSPEGWSIAEAEILLAGSSGRLIFDSEPGGPGTSMARPFRAAGGTARLAAPPDLPDGSETLALAFESFPWGAAFRFTADLDDRATGRAGSTIEGAEIAGARLRVTFVHADGHAETHEGLFDDRGEARAAAPCLS
jgi:hypothetical protein